MSDAQKVADRPAAEPPGANSVDRFFKISARGSTFAREIRGGLATFFTMAYILVLNPIILGNAKDKYGHTLDGAELVTATALVAAVMTIIMGVGGNLPLALAMRPRPQRGRRLPDSPADELVRRDGPGGPRRPAHLRPGGHGPA